MDHLLHFLRHACTAVAYMESLLQQVSNFDINSVIINPGHRGYLGAQASSHCLFSKCDISEAVSRGLSSDHTAVLLLFKGPERSKITTWRLDNMCMYVVQVMILPLILTKVPGIKHTMHSSDSKIGLPRAGKNTLSRSLSNNSSGNILV